MQRVSQMCGDIFLSLAHQVSSQFSYGSAFTMRTAMRFLATRSEARINARRVSSRRLANDSVRRATSGEEPMRERVRVDSYRRSRVHEQRHHRRRRHRRCRVTAPRALTFLPGAASVPPSHPPLPPSPSGRHSRRAALSESARARAGQRERGGKRWAEREME